MAKSIDFINNNNMQIHEEWLDIPNTNGLYQVSNLGSIKSYKKYNSMIKSDSFKILRQTIEGKGYKMINLLNKRFRTHTIIANAFLKKPSDKHQVNHINGVKTDNHISNLEWVTPSENMKHAWKTGLNKGNTNNGKK